MSSFIQVISPSYVKLAIKATQGQEGWRSTSEPM